jgi:putative transposase
MRKSRFTDEKMVAILRETNRDSVAAVAKRHGISEQTIYSWKKRFGTFEANDVRRLKQLELENARLKKLVAERDLELEVMKEIASSARPSAPRNTPQSTPHIPSRPDENDVVPRPLGRMLALCHVRGSAEASPYDTA